MKGLRIIIAVVFVFALADWAMAQGVSRSLVYQNPMPPIPEEIADDTAKVKKHSPGKAALFSLIPGGGQIYNKKYWKVPVIYAVGGGLVYLVVDNYNNYKLYRDSYVTRVNLVEDTNYVGPDHFPNISNSGLQSEMERHQRNYELAAVGVTLVYILQIVDAAVDAHLKTFDVSDDLSLGIRPAILGSSFDYQRGLTPTVGFKLNLKLK